MSRSVFRRRHASDRRSASPPRSAPRRRSLLLPLTCASLVSVSACAPAGRTGGDAAPTDSMPGMLTWSQQMNVRDQWLAKRHEMLLPMMRHHGIDMWIVVNEEFHDDPLAEYVAPARPYTGGRDIFVFIDTGEGGLRKVAVTGYWEENVARFFESPIDPKPAPEVLNALYAQYHPKAIGLGIGGRRGVMRSLTHDTYLYLSDAMGPEATRHFVSAAPLIQEYLATRIPEEHAYYERAVALTEAIVRKALSNEVITPGVTTVGDVRYFLYDELWRNHVGTWFQPDLRVQRANTENVTSRGFLAVAPESTVIQPGDLVHVDFGLSYMGLDTDWQKMAYVLKPGETDAPAGLRAALANTNALQDALMLRASRPGRTAGEVYTATMAEMESKGINAQVYSHPLGNQGHGLGPSIDFRAAQRGDTAAASQTLVEGSYISIELNTRTPVSEWGGQTVYVMEEDPAYLTPEGWKFFVPRQEAFYLIH